MQIKGEGLGVVLSRAERERRMPALITVASDEALLAQEAQDAIRATARALGYSEREVLQADARFDWSRLTQAAQGLSLFAAAPHRRGAIADRQAGRRRCRGARGARAEPCR